MTTTEGAAHGRPSGAVNRQHERFVQITLPSADLLYNLALGPATRW